MLGTRTKQVFSYGRRSHRVVNVYDDNEHRKPKDTDCIDIKRENQVLSTHISGKVVHASSIAKKPVVIQKIPVNARKKANKSPKAAKVGGVVVIKTARRHILGSIAPNAPASPAIPPAFKAKRRQPVAKPSSLTTCSPVVKADIILLDNQGRRVSQEHRILRADVQANVLATPSPKPMEPPRVRARWKKSDPIMISCDSEVELDVPLARPKRITRRRAKPIDDEDDSVGSDYAPSLDSPSTDTSIEEVRTPRLRRGRQRARANVVLSPSPTPSLSPSSSSSTTLPSAATIEQQDLAITPVVPAPVVITRNLTLPPQLSRPENLAPFASLPDLDQAGPSRSIARQLTPIRARLGRALFPAPASPPSPATTSELELDISFELEQLALSPRAFAEAQRLESAAAPHVPEYVRSLLDECVQTTPHEFSAFIQMFPSDPLVRLHNVTGLPKFQKIGEASFSEVFGIGNVVLKIVPLRNEERGVVPLDVEGPFPSDAKDVLKEIIVTKAMGECCSGFVELLRTYVVRGKYPSLLLDLWDEYDERKGSESVRPDTFTVSQLYAIIVLPNGGPDLEAYTFSTPAKTGWRQACSIFWQVARTLSEAEELVGFEHRDLHWGQILVKNVPTKKTSRRKTRTMDESENGILVTIIDLGLARMDAYDDAHWTPFDEETFEGEGDYQFDVYRMMRVHNGDVWAQFRPLTNVMWLHYLVLKLLQSKGLRPPTLARKSTAVQPAGGFGERECYECLKEVEGVLAQCLAGLKVPQTARKGRRKTQAPAKAVKEAPGLKSARELLAMAMARGWMA